MPRLIVGAIMLVAFTILVILNVNYKSTINLFGVRLENVSVVVIAIVAFAIGIVYSFFLAFINMINRLRRKRRQKIDDRLETKAAEAAARAETVAASAGQSESARGAK
jgi:uncharacterized integral membrane protein